MTPTSAATERAGRRRDHHGGFTLIEVVLALTIASMLATLAVPYFRANAGETALRARANEVASLLRRDRNMALYVQRGSMILVDANGGAIRSGLLGQSIVLPRGVTLRLLPEGAESIIFNADGSSSGARILLSGGRSAIAVDVNRLTAAIAVVEAGQ